MANCACVALFLGHGAGLTCPFSSCKSHVPEASEQCLSSDVWRCPLPAPPHTPCASLASWCTSLAFASRTPPTCEERQAIRLPLCGCARRVRLDAASCRRGGCSVAPSSMMRRPNGRSVARGGDRTKCRALATPPLPRLLRLASQCGAPWLCVAGRARRERCRWRRTQNERRNTFSRLPPTRAREACGGCETAFGFGHCCIRKWRRVRAAAVLPTERHLGERGGRKSERAGAWGEGDLLYLCVLTAVPREI